ncbi:hypothetical protein MCL26_10305 [Acinetobacter pittii]|jgi:hypothetical protein|uniref:hypothetical protein n=1 Tax=Acinetobacter pittii TaxID=48296 RepID=UPI001EFD60EB|nr:hypothetical protein [Acinetobacter pittii]MCG9515491.1 hypothetical protein [Acinetobacter pittii]WPP70735.1 hypothetical protein SOI81_03500 [Acinetobacter pittii]
MLNKFLSIVLKLVVYIFISIVSFLIVIIFLVCMADNFFEESLNKKRLKNSILYDHKIFPNLTESIFFYQRLDSYDDGYWIVVYPLDNKTKVNFLLKKQSPVQKKFTYSTIECIKPTIKKRWKTFNSNIHYVQPPESLRHHDDFEGHDSFNVYGSEKKIGLVEQACQQNKFIILEESQRNDHLYWAISANGKLLFSVYKID